MPDKLEKLGSINHDSVSVNDTLGELLEFKRNQLTRLHHEVLTEQASLARLKDAHKSALREQEYELRVAESNHKKRLESQLDVIVAERSRQENLDKELVARTKVCEELESKVSYIKAEIDKLSNERIDIEAQRVRNDEIRVENDRLSNEAYAINEDVKRRGAELKLKEAKVNKLLSNTEKQNTILDKRERDCAVQLKNLEEIKKKIDPKLSQIKQLSEQAEKDRVQAEKIRDGISVQEADLDKKRTELITLATQNEAKSKHLSEWEMRLKQHEAELKIDVQRSQVKTTEKKGKKGNKK